MDRFERDNLSQAIIGASLGVPRYLPDATSFRQCCELISAHWRSYGVNKTWKQIYEYSPSGELYKIFDWYRMACCWLQTNRALPAPKEGL